MATAAIYARYSTDEQRPTSLEDQIRVCKEKAEREGYTVPEELIFRDAAISGTGKALKKRAGYHALLKAWEEEAFEALIVDQQCRLFRDDIECALMKQRIERTNVRVLTAEGFDTRTPSWQVQFGLLGIINEQYARENRHRVIRGMKGQLERGFQIADAPFGYYAEKKLDEEGEPIGTYWRVHEEDAKIVREMYWMRLQGKSFAGIAEALNNRGIASPRRARDGTPGHWRPASVMRLLGNTIYRGTFVWNGSSATAAKAKKEKRALETQEFARPELRLVNDDTWYRCNERSGLRKVRGGARHPFARLVSCGECGSVLTVSGSEPYKAMYCSSCAQERRVGVRQKGVPYVSVEGLRQVLLAVLRVIFSGDCVAEFKDTLRKRLEGRGSGELLEVKERLAKVRKASERLARKLREIDDDDEFIERELDAVRDERKQLEARLAKLDQTLSRQDKKSIERQLKANPLRHMLRILHAGAVAERSRAVLGRLFPRITLLARPRRFVAVYELELSKGVAFAEAAGTEVVEQGLTTCRVRVSTSAKRPVEWLVEIL